MSEQKKPVIAGESVGALTQLFRTLRLVWRLLNDRRVPLFPKLIILAAIVYVLFPVDLAPDLVLGLGQLDDLGIIALAIALFIEACPRDIVEEHRRAIATQADSVKSSEENIIEGSYHEVPSDGPRQ